MGLEEAMSTTTIWCPYSGNYLNHEACSPEHIIPLSLGGSNAFTVMVSSELNAKAGSEIDAALATKDLGTMIRRREFSARGHSKQQPEVRIRTATYGTDQRPAQVTLRGQDGLTVWDAKERREIPEKELSGRPIHLRFLIKPYDRIRFVAKVALAAGYAIYGDLFRVTANHNDLRALMQAGSIRSAKKVLTSSNLRGCFDLYPIEKKDVHETRLQKKMCETVEGSVVITIPTTTGVLFTVGVLGHWVGTLNVPAVTDSYPIDEAHDLGQVTLLIAKQMEKISYRDFAKRMLEELTHQAPFASD